MLERKLLAVGAALMALAVVSPSAHAGAKLDSIKARGQLVCGVNTGLAGFALADSKGQGVGRGA